MQHACCVYGTHCLYLETKTKKCLFPPSFRTPEKSAGSPRKVPFPGVFGTLAFSKSNQSFQIPTYDQTHIFRASQKT